MPNVKITIPHDYLVLFTGSDLPVIVGNREMAARCMSRFVEDIVINETIEPIAQFIRFEKVSRAFAVLQSIKMVTTLRNTEGALASLAPSSLMDLPYNKIGKAA